MYFLFQFKFQNDHMIICCYREVFQASFPISPFENLKMASMPLELEGDKDYYNAGYECK